MGRHDPIYTHSVSSRRSANRTCGFPASGSLQDHAFAHGRSPVFANRLTSPSRKTKNSSGMRRVPCPPILCYRRNHQRSRGQGAPSSASSSSHIELDFFLRFHMQCLTEFLDRFRCYQTHSSITSRSLLPALLPDQGSFPPPVLPGLSGTTTPSATPEGRFRASQRHRWPAPLASHPAGFPVLHTIPLSHMPSPLPRRNRWVRMSLSFPNGGGLPRISGGSASALPFSRPAQRSLLVTAYALAESLTDPFPSEASTASLPPRPFRLLPAGTTLAGWELHPLRPCTFARHTEIFGLGHPHGNPIAADTEYLSAVLSGEPRLPISRRGREVGEVARRALKQAHHLH